MAPLAKMLILGGIAMAAFGVVLLFAGRIPWLGRLPGDIRVEGKNASFHFPIVTCLIISVVLTIVLNLFTRR